MGLFLHDLSCWCIGTCKVPPGASALQRLFLLQNITVPCEP